uniref:Uncharacterized protein n=1 Tax=Leersia perrieri TaxID=77586 RepID=A0A0D9UXB8_9ORYZ
MDGELLLLLLRGANVGTTRQFDAARQHQHALSCDWADFGPYLLLILEVWCGNSCLGEELLQEGIACSIICVDLSPVAV